MFGLAWAAPTAGSTSRPSERLATRLFAAVIVSLPRPREPFDAHSPGSAWRSPVSDGSGWLEAARVGRYPCRSIPPGQGTVTSPSRKPPPGLAYHVSHAPVDGGFRAVDWKLCGRPIVRSCK